MWRSCLILKGPQKEFESNAGCEGQLLESYLNICGILFWLWNRLKWSLFLLLLPCLKDTLKGKSSSMYIVQSQVLSSFSNCLSNIQRKLKNEKIMPYLLSDWTVTSLLSMDQLHETKTFNSKSQQQHQQKRASKLKWRGAH